MTRYSILFYSNYFNLRLKLLPYLYPPSTSGTVVQKLNPEFTLQPADLLAEFLLTRKRS